MTELFQLEGKWFIVMSNFPMWLKGDKDSPSFNYAVVKRKNGMFLSDRVSYFQKGKEKEINGFDKVISADNSEFIWRGRGILKLLKSRWEVLYMDPKNQWAIIYFEKTLFTPEGYDVISRHKSPDADFEAINYKLDELGVKSELRPINQDN